MRPIEDRYDGDVLVSLVPRDSIAVRWRAPASLLWSTRLDGHDIALERDSAGQHRFRLGALGDCLLSAEGRELACAPESSDNPVWQRMLLDTVFFCCRLVDGGVALHACAVARAGEGVAILAGSGGGKTSLALGLIDRGWSLLSDDVVFLALDGEAVRAHPGPPLMNVPAPAAGPELGTQLAQFAEGDEVWTEVRRHDAKVAALRTLCFLDRRPGPRLELRTIPPNPMLITANAIYLARGELAERARFEVLSDVAARVPALHLRADPSVTPLELAQVVADAVVDTE
jgi:hypothetical protein